MTPRKRLTAEERRGNTWAGLFLVLLPLGWWLVGIIEQLPR